ncbi:MAG TPA: RNA methyltransferase [Planctomicrobium sp.]|nr:RNA methyltransferase [Planctomicrobium sp.]
MNSPVFSEQQLVSYLLQFLTPERRNRFVEVLRWRTNLIQVGLVDLFQKHNASAVLRSCDALGIQQVHVVESYNEFETNHEIALGSEQWLTLNQYTGPSAIEDSLTTLRSKGIRVVATALHADSLPIDEVPLDQPIALFFGNEKEGLPQSFIDAADVITHIPMYGFVESYNVSVAAALSLQTLLRRLRSSSLPWQLDEEEYFALLLEWTRKSIRKIDLVEKQFHLHLANGTLPETDLPDLALLRHSSE